MRSIIGNRIDYNGVDALKGQRQRTYPAKINPSTPLSGGLRVVAQSLKPVKLLATCKRAQQLPTLLGVVACVLVVVFKRMQQLPTMLGQPCKELLGACWQWCANGCNHAQQRWANNVGSCCVRLHLISFSLSQAWPLFVFLQR